MTESEIHKQAAALQGSLQKSLQELWLTAACKVLGEVCESPFEIEAAEETESQRSLGVCSEFRIAGDCTGRLAFGIPAASREFTKLLLPAKPGDSKEKTWDEFAAKVAKQWLGLVAAETGLVATVKRLKRGTERNAREEFAGIFSTLKSAEITLPVYLSIMADTIRGMDVAVTVTEEGRPEAPHEPRDPVSPPSLHETGTQAANLDLLLDIELQASLRFGSREMALNEILELGPGDVVPLDRTIQAPVDLVVGDRIVARGEVVLVDGNYGLRVTEVVEPRKRLETVRCLF